MTTRPRLSVALSLACAVIVVGVLFCVGRLLLVSSVECRRGSIDYYLFIANDPVTSLPTPEATAKPSFFYSPEDGPKPMMISLEFCSRLSPAAAQAALHSYLLQNGYKLDTPIQARTYTKNNTQLALEITSEGEQTRVFATHAFF